MIRAGVLGLLVAIAAAAPAAAAPPPVDRPLTSPTITAALTAAADFWHVAPSTAAVFAATIDELEAATGTAGAIGTATVGHVWILDVGANPRTVEDRIAICDVITHELGHALGHEHTADRGSVMFEAQRADRAVYECWRRFTPLASLRRWRIPARGPRARARSTHAGAYLARPRWLTR